MPSPRWLATLTIPIVAGAALVSSAAIAMPIPMTHTSLNCAPSASVGRPTTTPPSPQWGA
jgi:hypothetical protein